MSQIRGVHLTKLLRHYLGFRKQAVTFTGTFISLLSLFSIFSLLFILGSHTCQLNTRKETHKTQTGFGAGTWLSFSRSPHLSAFCPLPFTEPLSTLVNSIHSRCDSLPLASYDSTLHSQSGTQPCPCLHIPPLPDSVLEAIQPAMVISAPLLWIPSNLNGWSTRHQWVLGILHAVEPL